MSTNLDRHGIAVRRDMIRVPERDPKKSDKIVGKRANRSPIADGPLTAIVQGRKGGETQRR